MIKLQTLKTMRSVRDFKDDILLDEDKALIISRFDELKEKYSADLNMKIIDGKELLENSFDDEIGYNGIIIEAPYYIVVEGEETIRNATKTGQIFEYMMLELFEKKIGSCWISVNENSPKFNAFINNDPKINVISLIAFGYADLNAENVVVKEQKKTIFSWINPYKNKFNDNSVSSDREAIDNFVLNFSMRPISVEELEKRNLDEVISYARFAPSYENRQPWKYVLMNNGIAILIEENDKLGDTSRFLEAGIAMTYFELSMHINGYKGQWDVDARENINYSNYQEAGVYKYE